MDTCDEVEDRCDFTECEPVIPDGEICRTAGFWSTHAGFELVDRIDLCPATLA